MSDVIAKGRAADETDAMRAKREAMIAASPPPQVFKLRAEMLEQGRSDETVAKTENMTVRLKVYAGGGENGLHNHGHEDHFHLVLSGRARFFGPRGEARELGPYEGIMLPAGCFYRFHALGGEPLVLLRVSAPAEPVSPHRRSNVYGEPLPSRSKANGRVDPIVREGQFWGAAE